MIFFVVFSSANTSKRITTRFGDYHLYCFRKCMVRTHKKGHSNLKCKNRQKSSIKMRFWTKKIKAVVRVIRNIKYWIRRKLWKQKHRLTYLPCLSLNETIGKKFTIFFIKITNLTRVSHTVHTRTFLLHQQQIHIEGSFRLAHRRIYYLYERVIFV